MSAPFRPLGELVPEPHQPTAAAHQQFGEVIRELTESPEQAQFDEFAIHRSSLDGLPLRRGTNPFLTAQLVTKLLPRIAARNFRAAAKLGGLS